MNGAAIAAVKAYAAQAKAIEQSTGLADAASGSGAGAGTGFADILSSSLESARKVGKTADTGLMATAVGKAEVVDVVTAVAEAELTVQTIVSVRDRVISAYQQILRMPI